MTSILSEKKVLVTGAAGFIGSHLTETLVKSGAAVRAFIRYNSRGDPGLLSDLEPEILKNIEIISGDLRDYDAVKQAMQGIEVAFHLGALIAIPYSYVHPAEVIETNVIGTTNVLLAARDQSVRRIVHTSTSEVYGSALRVPIDETHPLQGQSPYSASKIGADKIAESFYCAFNLPVVTIRPFNTYGPRQSARAVIPTIITQALKQGQIRLGNLAARRDFTFVSDTVDGFLCGATAEHVEGKTINLGTGSDISIADLVERVSAILNQHIEVQTDDNRLRPAKSEVVRLISDNRLAQQILGWQPRVGLDTGLSKTIEWISTHLNRYEPHRYQI